MRGKIFFMVVFVVLFSFSVFAADCDAIVDTQTLEADMICDNTLIISDASGVLNTGSYVVSALGLQVNNGKFNGGSGFHKFGYIFVGESGQYMASSGLTTIMSESEAGKAFENDGFFNHNSGTISINTSDANTYLNFSGDVNNLIINSQMVDFYGGLTVAGTLVLNDGEFLNNEADATFSVAGVTTLQGGSLTLSSMSNVASFGEIVLNDASSIISFPDHVATTLTKVTVNDGEVDLLTLGTTNISHLIGHNVELTASSVSAPADWQSVSGFVDIARIGDNPSAEVYFYYIPGDLKESDFKIGRYNGTWNLLDGTINEEGDTASITLTELSSFSVLGNTTPVDDSVPVIVLIDPQDGGLVETTSVELKYNVSDASSVECEFYLDDLLNQTDTSITKDANQSFSLTLENDVYGWFVKCVDIWGKSAQTDAIAFTVQTDVDAPTFDVTVSANNVKINETVTVTCTGDSSINNTRVYIGSETVCEEADNECVGTYIPDGTGQVTIQCTITDGGETFDDFVVLTVVAEEGQQDEDQQDEDQEQTTKYEGIMTLHGGEEKSITVNNHGVTEVFVTVANNVTDALLTVDELATTNLVVPSEKVYKYLEITFDGTVESAKVRFAVPMTWLNENNVTADQIVLGRYNDGWETLNTKMIETGTDVVFEAETAGFSTFAVYVKESGFELTPPFEFAIVLVLAIVIGVLFFLRWQKTEH